MEALSREWLRQRGYTISSAARALNISRNHICQILLGNRDSKTLKDALLALPPRKLILRERTGKTPQTSNNDMKQAMNEENAITLTTNIEGGLFLMDCFADYIHTLTAQLRKEDCRNIVTANALMDHCERLAKLACSFDMAVYKRMNPDKQPTQNKNHE